MTTKNKLLLTVATVTVVGGSLLAYSPVSAQETAPQNGPMAKIVQRLATRFGLNEADVQKVFAETHDEMMSLVKAEQEARLQELVTAGTITEAQRQLIITKRAELEANREVHRAEMANKSLTERKATREAHRAELEAWAQANGIDLEYLMMGGRGHQPGEGRGRLKMYQEK